VARKKGQISKFLVGIMLVAIMFGLAGFGVTNFGGRVQAVGEVGGVEIEVNQYARALTAGLQDLQQRVGQNISLDQARQFGLDTQVLGQLIAGAALENETKRIGLSVGDAEVQRQLLATQGFRGGNGQFDRSAYEFTLQRNNLTPQEYEADIRNQTAGALLQSAVTSGVAAPTAYSDVMLAYLGERRSFSWLQIDAAALNEPVGDPAEADLLAYFDANPDNYVLPAAKSITYAWLTPDSVADKVEVSEDDLLALYAARDAEFNIPQRRLVERVAFATMSEAETAAASITDGSASFEDVVATRGLSLADVDLGAVARDALGNAGDAAFALSEPGVTGAVDTALGPGILRVSAILAAQSTPFEDVRAQLQQEAAAENARRYVDDQIAEFDDLLAGGATLEELALETDMQLAQIDWVAGESDGIAADTRFVNAASLIAEGDFPEIETLNDGGIFALRLDALIAERPDSFANARAQVVTDWSAAALSDALQNQTDTLLAGLGTGALSGLGLPVSVETNVKRDAVYLGKPIGFLDTIFQMETGATASVASDRLVVIVQLNTIAGADPLDPDRDRLQQVILNDTAQTIGQDTLVAFSRALQLNAGISLNQSAISAVHAQFAGTGVSFVPTQNQGGMGGPHTGN